MRNYFLWMSKESDLEMESTPSEYTVKTIKTTKDENIINRLDEIFKGKNVDNIAFIIYDSLEEIFINLGYSVIYKSYIIED